MDLTDNLVAIAALFSCIISLVSILFTYRSNKENNYAKLSEKTFEKRLDAFRELDEYVGKVLFYCSENNILDKNFFEQLEILYENLYICHQKQRVFLPPEIDNSVDCYLSIIYEYKKRRNDSKNIESYTVFYKSLKKQRFLFITEIQKQMGRT
jgi:hypothetical protein